MEYTRDHALLIAKAMVDFYRKGTTNTWSFGQQHILQKGLKMFKEKGHAAAMKELDQLHKRMCFTPVDINDLTTSEKKKSNGSNGSNDVINREERQNCQRPNSFLMGNHYVNG